MFEQVTSDVAHSVCSHIELILTYEDFLHGVLILFLKALAHHLLACKWDGGSCGDDNEINGCPKTSPKKFSYFVPGASVGRA